jgi:site-specific recombinase XerD
MLRKSVVTVFVRHNGSCSHAGSEFYRGCDCPKWIRYSLNGKQHREATGTRTWGIAEEKAHEKQNQLDAGQNEALAPTADRPTIEKAIETFMVRKLSEGISSATERKLRYHLVCFEKFLSARSRFFPSDITTTDAVEFKASWTNWKSSVTRQKAQQNIRGFVRFACRGDHRQEILDAFGKIKESKADSDRLEPKPFTEAELKKLLAQVPVTFTDSIKAARVTALIHCMVSTGMAIRDTVQLEIKSLKDGRLRIKRQKTGKAVTQKLDPGLHWELTAVTNGNPRYVFWNGTSLPESATGLWQTDLRKLMEDAGLWIKGNLSHRFRDTAVDFWLGAGCSMTEIAALLGDTVTVVERHYADLASKRMEDRLAKLPVRTW